MIYKSVSRIRQRTVKNNFHRTFRNALRSLIHYTRVLSLTLRVKTILYTHYEKYDWLSGILPPTQQPEAYPASTGHS